MTFMIDPGITDPECKNFTERLELRYAEPGIVDDHPLRDTHVDPIGYTRWETSYVVKRQTGHSHEHSVSRVLDEIIAIEAGHTLPMWDEPNVDPPVVDPGITDAECIDFTQRLEMHYFLSVTPAYGVRQTRVDVLGYTRWESSYVVKRQTGQSHETATRNVIKEIDRIRPVPGPTPIPPGPTPTPGHWTKQQLRDIQGDLMVFCPQLGLDWSGEVEPTTGIRCRADNGSTPRGLHQGWFWTVWIWTLPPAKRQVVYDEVRRLGWTHFAIGVQDMGVGDPSYHGLRPLTAEEVAGYGPLMMTIHAELIANNLVPICAGVAPGDPSQGGAPLAPGFDGRVALIAMSDWDNTNKAAERILYLAEHFPTALIYFERVQGYDHPQPDPSPGDPVTPTRTNGAEWVHGMREKVPNFVGVLYEVNFPDGLQKIAGEILMCHRWWFEVDENRFETNTYWKFWDGGDVAMYDELEIQIQQQCSYLRGYMSGGPSHPPPLPDPEPGSRVDEIDMGSVTVLGSDPACLGFPIVASFDSFGLRPPTMSIRSTGAKHWPAVAIVDGGEPAQAGTLWLFMQIGGVWHATGAERLRPDQIDGDKPEGSPVDGVTNLVSRDWLYDPHRWGPMCRDPLPGEVVGVMLVAGSTRSDNNTPVKERTNVIRVTWPDAVGANPLARG